MKKNRLRSILKTNGKGGEGAYGDGATDAGCGYGR